MDNKNSLIEKAVNALRFLSADGVQNANSGHPGLPMGAATMAYVLWTRHLRHHPKRPDWPNRDRFILSGGHGSMLLYSLLYLTGYEIELDELKNFRQWGSRTAGHPEYGLIPGIESTTGPLGQGFANGVGMAIAGKQLAARFNTEVNSLFDYKIYAIVTDGDLMEGVTSEAASLAGHLSLGNLIYLYDDNHISIDGSTDLAFTEDRLARFEAYHWHVQYVPDGNDVAAIDQAIVNAKNDLRPSIIAVRTQIGYGLPTRAGTEKAHGEPPGEAELDGAKQQLGWPLEPKFFVPSDVLDHFRQAIEIGDELVRNWEQQLAEFQAFDPDGAGELERRLQGKLPEDWERDLPMFPADTKGLATRDASGQVLNAIALKIPELIGGSADLAPSNKTWIKNQPSFQKDHWLGRNFHFGVREHAMGAIVNGLALNGGFIPYGGTFLVFSDYMRGALRLSALSHYPSIWIFTHDSIGVGEDGPTHQPIEHVASLRAIPNMVVIRPCDANETREAWKIAVLNRGGPTALILTRQAVATLDRKVYSPAENLKKGAYVLADLGPSSPELLLMASGSEVGMIVEAGTRLVQAGMSVRLVSFPSWELFNSQEKSYQELVFPPNIRKRLAVEAGIGMGWERWVGDQGDILSIERYGASAPYKRIYQEYGLTVDEVVKRANILLS